MTTTGALTLSTTGTISQLASTALTATALTLNGSGNYSLANTGNSFTTLAANTGSINLYNAAAATSFGTVTTTGAFAFNTGAGGVVTQTGVLTAASADLQGGTSYTLNSANSMLVRLSVPVFAVTLPMLLALLSV